MQVKRICKIIGVSLWSPLSPNLNPHDSTIWGVLESKTIATFHPNIGSFKTAIEEARAFEYTDCISFEKKNPSTSIRIWH